jgi:chromosome partitioning protein
MQTIAVINQKGGVGKTTTAVNMGHALALRGKRVMLIDLDPQGHMAPCLGVFRAPRDGVDQALLHGRSLGDVSIATRELLQLVPAGDSLGEVERLQGGMERGRLLGEAIKRSEPDVDYVLFDCPPSAGLLVMNAVLAAGHVLIPVAGDYLSLTGLAHLMTTLRRVEGLREQPLHKHVFMSRYVPRRRLSREVLDKVMHYFPQHLMPTSIREAAVLAECAGAGRTIFEYRGKSKSADEFRTLADDFLHARVISDEQQASHVA